MSESKDLKQVPGHKLVKLYTTHPNGDVDSSSVRHQYFNDEIFKEYEREDEQTGKVNTLHDLGLKYEVVQGKPDDDAPDIKTKEIEVDGVKFTVVKDDGGFSATQTGDVTVPITASNSKMADLKKDLSDKIKLANA